MPLPAEAARMRAQVHASINQSRDANRSRDASRAADSRRDDALQFSEAAALIEPRLELATGLTGHTVLLHADDVALYRQHLRDYQAEYRPHGLRERELVQSMADSQWRLARIPGLEMAIYAAGRTTQIDAHISELDTFLRHEKELRNLHLQEARLLRRYEKERKELQALQAARQQHAAEKAHEEPKSPTSVLAPATLTCVESSRPPETADLNSETISQTPRAAAARFLPDTVAASASATLPPSEPAESATEYAAIGHTPPRARRDELISA